MADALEKLKKCRSVVRSLTTKLINKTEETILDTELSKNEMIEILEETLDQLVEKSVSLQKLDSEVEQFAAIEELENEIIQSEDYQEKIVKTKFKINKFVKSTVGVNKDSLSNQNGDSFNSEVNRINHGNESKLVKLPKLTISKFYGESCSWLEFWSQFKLAIHDNEALSKIEQFVYLKSLLSGSAANAVTGISLTEENYDSVIKLLTKRFGRNDLIISSHINKLLNLDPVRSSYNIKALRKLCDDCDIQIRNLETLGVAAGSFGNLLCPILLKLIPEDMTLEFSRKRKNKDNWDIFELMSFLREEVECREATNFMNDSKEIKTNNIHTRHKEIPGRSNYNKNIPTAAALNTNFRANCLFCNSDKHQTFNCPDMSVDEKTNKLKIDGRCFRCFKKFHWKFACKSKIKPCENCNSTHHQTVICNVKMPENTSTIVSTMAQKNKL